MAKATALMYQPGDPAKSVIACALGFVAPQSARDVRMASAPEQPRRLATPANSQAQTQLWVVIVFANKTSWLLTLRCVECCNVPHMLASRQSFRPILAAVTVVMADRMSWTALRAHHLQSLPLTTGTVLWP